MRLSVILATFNEEKNIKDCLDSVKGLADEIVVVDGSSTDRTVAIAQKLGARVMVKDNPLMFHQNKQLAIKAAAGDWILYLDADERITPELKKEIKTAVRKKNINGYWLPRKNIIFGKWIEHTGWWPDKQLRLFRQGKAFLPCQSVHEQPQLKGKAGELGNALIHYNYQSVTQFIDKLNRLYTENDKNIFLKEKEKLAWSDFIRQPLGEFLKRFFQQEGYKDGFHGLVLSLLQSFSVLVTLAKVWEQQGFEEIQPNDFVDKVDQEAKKAGQEIRYWLLSGKIDQAEDLVHKLALKLKRKLK